MNFEVSTIFVGSRRADGVLTADVISDTQDRMTMHADVHRMLLKPAFRNCSNLMLLLLAVRTDGDKVNLDELHFLLGHVNFPRSLATGLRTQHSIINSIAVKRLYSH